MHLIAISPLMCLNMMIGNRLIIDQTPSAIHIIAKHRRYHAI